MDKQLKTIIASAESLSKNLQEHGSISKDAVAGSQNGISLLSLKNQAMLSYIHNLAFITASQIARSDENEDTEKLNELRTKAIEGTINQRVTLEKGVKGLESKMAYQIEKLLRANSKAFERQDNSKAQTAKSKNDDNDEDEESDSDDDDALNYKPNVAALGNKGGATRSNTKSAPRKQPGEDDEKPAKYQAPKISAVTPFAKDHESKSTRKQKNATMEEYLKHSSTAPIAEPSIGSTIMDHGRGGERTERDRRKQDEVKRFEEENYKRVNLLSKKEEKRAARQRQRDAYGKNFFGEDWGLSGNNSKSIETATKRKDKPSSVWERTKKRQRRG